jgi:hypothetical protein
MLVISIKYLFSCFYCLNVSFANASSPAQSRVLKSIFSHPNFILFSYLSLFIHSHLVRLVTVATDAAGASSYHQNLYYYYMEICLIQFPPAKKKKLYK